jgi:hypothetical protein
MDYQVENWVKLRNECSVLDMFLKLKEGSKHDVDERNAIPKPGQNASFRIRFQNEKGFSVIREGQYPFDWVDVSWDNLGIYVKNRDEAVVYKATITLTDEGECALRLSTGEELNCWQFRKKILEGLLFNF